MLGKRISSLSLRLGKKKVKKSFTIKMNDQQLGRSNKLNFWLGLDR